LFFWHVRSLLAEGYAQRSAARARSAGHGRRGRGEGGGLQLFL
jgi:hypothetical protein